MTINVFTTYPYHIRWTIFETCPVCKSDQFDAWLSFAIPVFLKTKAKTQYRFFKINSCKAKIFWEVHNGAIKVKKRSNENLVNNKECNEGVARLAGQVTIENFNPGLTF